MVDLFHSKDFSMSLQDRITFHLVRIQGNFTVNNLLDVRKEFSELFQSDNRNLVLDLEECQYMDSSALGIIINVYKKLRDSNGILLLLRPSLKIENLLKETNLIQIIQVLKTLEEADEFFD
jgi:anti-anti-sigma factor